MLGSESNNNLKEVLKNTNKVEFRVLIIKADFLFFFERENIFMGAGRWKALIQP